MGQFDRETALKIAEEIGKKYLIRVNHGIVLNSCGGSSGNSRSRYDDDDDDVHPAVRRGFRYPFEYGIACYKPDRRREDRQRRGIS